MSDQTKTVTTSPNGNGTHPAGWKEYIQAAPDLPEQAIKAMIHAGSQAMLEALASEPGSEPGTAWQWRGLNDLLSPMEPVRQIVNGVIVEQSVTLIFGTDGSMKSMLAMDMAICVATGKEWLIGLDSRTTGFKTRPATVLWYDADNGEYTLKERFRAFMAGHNVQPDRLHYVSFPEPLLDASNDESVQALVNDIKHLGAELVIFDNLSTISGDKDENSPEIIEVMKRLKLIAETTGAAVIIIHHATKQTKGYRGHSRIRQTADLALKVDRSSPTADVVEVRADKVRRKPVNPFAGLFTYENGGDLLTSARFFGVVPSDIPDGQDKPNKTEQAKDDILELLKDNPGLNQSQIVKELTEVNRKTVLKALHELELEGALLVKDGDRGSKIYQLTF